MIKLKYFKLSEFDSPDEVGSGSKMNPVFLQMLDSLRKACGFPLIINSGYRTKVHNKKVGGAKNSAHLYGLAADIKISDSKQRYVLLKNAFALGFSGIAIEGAFVHVDMGCMARLPRPSSWVY